MNIKKLVSLLLACMMLVSMTSAFADKISTDIHHEAPYATAIPVIDGEADEVWANVPEIVTLGEYTPDIGQGFATVKVMWTETALYFYAVVEDWTIQTDPNNFNECFCIVGSQTNDDSDAYSLPTDFALFQSPGGILRPTFLSAEMPAYECAYKVYADAETPHYTVEAMVPLLDAENPFTAGRVIGLEFGVDDDADGDGARDVYCNWLNLGAFWSSPAALGNVKLVNSAADAPTSGGDLSLLNVPKTEYAYGEPILISAVGSGTDWVGIYSPELEGGSMYWTYVTEVGSGVEFDMANVAHGNVEKAVLAPGSYTIRLMPNDNTDVNLSLAWVTITVLPE